MNEKERTHITIRLTYLVMAAITIVFLYVCFTMVSWAYANENVLDIKGPIQIKNKVVKKGGVVILQVDYCKHVDASGVIERKLISKRGEYLFPTVKDTIGAGCDKIEAPSLLPVLPVGATPDTYHIEYKATYKLNPLKQNIVEQFRTEEFVVK